MPPASTSGLETGALSKMDILGRWALLSWVQAYDDGRMVHPMGEQLTGSVQYGQKHMSCLIGRLGRPAFKTGSQWNARPEDKLAAFDSFLGYSGTYELVGDEVIHHVVLSLYPNWQGGMQRRHGRLVDGQLHLTARLEEGTPEARTASLVWERLDD